MSFDELLSEASKLAAQLFVALLVARIAVHWALRRYKSEKTWERRLVSYVECVAAVSEMRLIAGQMLDEIENGRLPSAERNEKLHDRNQNARAMEFDLARTATRWSKLIRAAVASRFYQQQAPTRLTSEEGW